MFDLTRRRILGKALIGSSVALSACGLKAPAMRAQHQGRVLLDQLPHVPQGLVEAANFPLLQAIHGRRSRRFARGASIPDGPLAYTSKHPSAPLTELEQMLLLTTVGGNTGWSNLIPYNRNYLPGIPNYAAAAGGRSFPSGAGFHSTEFFYTDDQGSYFMPTRDLLPTSSQADAPALDLAEQLARHRSRVVKLANGRLVIPAKPAHMELHNEWCANVPGSTLIIPVADLARHSLLNLCYLVQNGSCVFDDINNRPIPGIEKFSQLVDVNNAFPISILDQMGLTEVTVEISTACYSGALMLQAMGLGGWMYNGINPISVLGASGDPEVPGLGFDFDLDERWPLPNVTGLKGHFEGHCPPHFADMRAAVASVVKQKFGSGGPYNAQTAGPYKDNGRVRSSGAAHNEEFIDCVATMAQYIYDSFGRFPATVPSMFAMMYLQAHQLETGFYDKHLSQGAYLHTHAMHDRNWGGA